MVVPAANPMGARLRFQCVIPPAGLSQSRVIMSHVRNPFDFTNNVKFNGLRTFN